MKVYVNNRKVEIPAGMTVKHALISAGKLKEITAGKKVCDRWGNEVGLDGALQENDRLVIRKS